MPVQRNTRDRFAELHQRVRADRAAPRRCRCTTASRTSPTTATSSRLGNNLVDGLSNGAIWALVALGYTLVYGIIELINFAHGEVFMIGSLVSAGLFGTLGLTTATGTGGLILGLLVTLVLAMLASGALNVMIERVAYRPLRSAPKLAPLITAVGFSFILQNVGILWIGGSPEGIPDLINAQKELFSIGGVSISQGDVLAVAATIPLVLLLTTFISQSRLGKAMRATAQDPEAARLMGINVDTTISLTFLLGGLMAGAAGLIYALYQTTIWFFQGFQAGLIAFTAAVMGGIGNLQGAVLGGLIIGIIQQISDNRIGGEWTPAIVFAYLVLIMVFQPAGPARRGDAGGRMSATAEQTRYRAEDRSAHAHRSGAGLVVTLWMADQIEMNLFMAFVLGAHRRAPSSTNTWSSRHGRRVPVGRSAALLPRLGPGSSRTDARARLHGDGARAEHHRRLRRAARPRLRGLLRARRAHRPAGSCPASSSTPAAARASFLVGEPASSLPGIHLNFLLVWSSR